MRKEINLNTWKRREHYKFFKEFEDPFWSITTEVDCTKAYKFCKGMGRSFFLYYLHKSLIAANETPEFKQRIENGKVYQYEVIHASPTISRDDGTFGFAYFDFDPVFESFAKQAKAKIEKVKNESGLKPAVNNENIIHYSTVPWIHFSGIEHPKNNVRSDSIPKIVFGKTLEKDDKIMLPVFVRVNHALVDAIHIGKFINRFQELLNSGE